jgi:hypothetical protein
MKRSKLVRRLGVTKPNNPKMETRGKGLKAHREIQTNGETSGDEGTVEEERVGIRFDESEGLVGIANGTNWCAESRPGGSVLHGLVTLL